MNNEISRKYPYIKKQFITNFTVKRNLLLRGRYKFQIKVWTLLLC